MQAKDDRLSALLSKTDACLHSLAERLGAQMPDRVLPQAQAAGASAAAQCISLGRSDIVMCANALIAVCIPQPLLRPCFAQAQGFSVGATDLAPCVSDAAAELAASTSKWNALALHSRPHVAQPAMLQGPLHPHQMQARPACVHEVVACATMQLLRV